MLKFIGLAMMLYGCWLAAGVVAAFIFGSLDN